MVAVRQLIEVLVTTAADLCHLLLPIQDFHVVLIFLVPHEF